KRLVTGYHGLRFFDLPSCEERAAHNGHTGPIYAMAVAGHGNQLISGGQDRTVRMWDLSTGKEKVCIATPGPVYGLALAPDSGILAAMGNDAITVYEAASPQPSVELRHAGPVQKVAFSPDGKTLASCAMDGTKLWDPDEGRELASFGKLSSSWFYGLAF